MNTKQKIRKYILQKRDALTQEERQQKSHRIAEMVIEHADFQKADKMLLFASYRSEVDTSGIFETAQKNSIDIYYPKVVGDEMEFYRVCNRDELLEGYRGISEPEASEIMLFTPNANDRILVLMPGVAFDEMGSRIGYGKGFYDKFIQKLEQQMPMENLIKMAIAFECQIIEKGQIRRESHDIKPDYIVTEHRIINISSDSTN